SNMRLSAGRMPPSDGKSHYRLPQGNLMIRGDTFEQLVERVFEFRLRNNVPVGDIESEIHKFYCNQWPAFCHSDAADQNRSTRQTTGESMLNRVARWVA